MREAENNHLLNPPLKMRRPDIHLFMVIEYTLQIPQGLRVTSLASDFLSRYFSQEAKTIISERQTSNKRFLFIMFILN